MHEKKETFSFYSRLYSAVTFLDFFRNGIRRLFHAALLFFGNFVPVYRGDANTKLEYLDKMRECLSNVDESSIIKLKKESMPKGG